MGGAITLHGLNDVWTQDDMRHWARAEGRLTSLELERVDTKRLRVSNDARYNMIARYEYVDRHAQLHHGEWKAVVSKSGASLGRA